MYELYIISLIEEYAFLKFNQMQLEGWELAGSITTYQFNSKINKPTITIPLKRKIKP